MKILYIGNFGAPHSTENEVRKALEHLGHDVAPAQEGSFDWTHLGRLAHREHADFVLWTHTHGLAPADTHAAQTEGLDALRADGVPSVAYHLDRWWGLAREYQAREEPFFRCDLVVTADGGHDEKWAEIGVNHQWLPPAVSEFELDPGTPRDQFTSPLAFVGSWQGGYHDEWKHRRQLIAWLQQQYGHRIAFWPRRGEHAIRGADLRDLYASVDVVIGDSCLAGRATHYISDRVPETIGRGGFLVHPRVEGVTDGTHYTEGEHLVCWDVGDWDALRATIDRYLEAPFDRGLIADDGREHVREHHTYTVRMRQLLELVAAL